MTPTERADLADLERELTELDARQRAADAWADFRDARDGIRNARPLTAQESADLDALIKEIRA